MEKKSLHTKNLHKNGYDFDLLTKHHEELKAFIVPNKAGNDTISFFNPEAVKALNKALLKVHYGINWNLPDGFLCPPIPGRADYIHHVADLLPKHKKESENTRVLDIGTGANCIYPILGNSIYQWKFVGTEINSEAIKSAKTIINKNKLAGNITVKLQKNKNNILKGLIKKEEVFDVCICNPPFHASEKEAKVVALKKARNLSTKKVDKAILNFGGQANELWYPGGEYEFVKKLILESQDYPNIHLFTCLISKKESLVGLKKLMKELDCKRIDSVPMHQGNKISRFLVWKF